MAGGLIIMLIMHSSSAPNFPFAIQPTNPPTSLGRDQSQRNPLSAPYSLAAPHVAAVHSANSYLTSVPPDRPNRNLVTLHTDSSSLPPSSFPSFHNIYSAVAANRSEFPTHSLHAAFQPNPFALTNAAGFHLPGHLKASRPPEFQPLRRTLEAVRELPVTLAEQPLVIEDLEDRSG